MNKSFKSLFSCILIAMMLLSSTSIVFADSTTLPVKSYVALGDSTSFGLSDPAYGGYTRMYYYNNLKESGYSYTNLSVPGHTTTDLINVINNNKTLIKNASIITINIGGNNLLGPFMQSVASLYGLSLANYPDDPDGSKFLTDLATKITLNKDPLATFEQLLDPSNPITKTLNQSLLVGLAKFQIEFPIIIAKVKLLAPKAKIYVNTIHNPAMKAMAGEDPMISFYQRMDKLIQSMNSAIKTYSPFLGYKCVDVYAAFAKSDGVLSFSIPNAIAALRVIPPNLPDYQLFKMYCDPHPTTIGHQVIYQALLACIN